MTALPDILDDYALLDSEDRYRLLIDLGRQLDPMPDALKTDATRVRGCSASVWVYPTQSGDGRLHFLADSNAAITKGVVALILAVVQDRMPGEIASMDIAVALAPFDLKRELSSNPKAVAAIIGCRPCCWTSPSPSSHAPWSRRS